MAQVLNYYKWPDRGEGSISFRENGGATQTFDFSETTFDYSDMLDAYSEGNYTPEQANAVATLMLACGRASKMVYSAVESGASDWNMQFGLINYLRYNPGTKLLLRDFMSQKE